VRRMLFKVRFLGLVFPALLVGMSPVAAQAAGGLGLGTAAGFAVLADSTGLTCTDSSVIGPVGVSSSGTAITSTRCKMQTQLATSAYADFLTAYNGFATVPPCNPSQILSGTLAGVTLAPGAYCFPAAATLTGTLTLSGTGPWIFEIGTSGTGALTATNFTVVGSNPCNATWWVRQAVTLKTSVFQGTILAGADITLTGTALAGRALATGAVTMTGSNVFGCTAGGTVAKHHCNQGVGNGPEGCDPGNSNHHNSSNDELGGTPGDPGRQGRKSSNAAATVTSTTTSATNSATSDATSKSSGHAVGGAAGSATNKAGNAVGKGKGKSNGKNK
jgi:hypothetical protein